MTQTHKPRWWHAWLVYSRPEAWRMLLLGFSAGLPLLLVLGTLTLRLSEAGIARKEIGYLSWVALVYGFKWVWSPLVDSIPIPLLTSALGRRRSWLLLAQAGIIGGLLGMAATDVKQGLAALVGFSLLVAFSSATQDIALDAYRIESAEKKVQAALSATYQAGYRLAMIWSGAGALWIAARVQQEPTGYDPLAWQIAYLAMAASMLVGIITVLFSPEKPHQPLPSPSIHEPWGKRLEQWLISVVIAPFAEFLKRYRWQAFIVLALIAVYRISDVVMGVMSNPFYNEMGYTKDQIAATSKVFGLIMTLVGTFIGGVLVMRAGVFRILMLGAILSAATNLLFAWLAFQGNALGWLDIHINLGSSLWTVDLSGKVVTLVAVISMDNLSGGIASAAFIGYLSSLTNVQFSASQYALFSSLMMLIPKFVGGFSGNFIDSYNYPTFFICTAIIGIPVIVLVWLTSWVHEFTKQRPLHP